MPNNEQSIILDTRVLEHQGTRVLTCRLDDDGVFPNNPSLPLLVYKNVLKETGDLEAEFARRVVERGWEDRWRNGIYPLHHYHSTSHEILGIAAGTARVQFGGPTGVILELEAGDAVVIPAGVSHRNETNDPELLVVGAYPDGSFPDILTPDEDYDDDGGDDVRAAAMERIAALDIPATDPLFGPDGPLVQLWKKSP